MKRACRLLAWIAGVPLVGFALLVAASFWYAHQREVEFTRLPEGERQLAIFDAFADAVESNYYDRDFVEKEWPALRDRWRTEAGKSRNDFDVYFTVLLQLTQSLPSSHLAAVPPPPRVADHPASASPPPQIGTGGFGIAKLRRARNTVGVVDHVEKGSAAAMAGIEPGWQVMSFKGCAAGDEVTGVFLTALSPAQRLDFEAGKQVALNDPAIRTQAEFDAKFKRSVTYACTRFVDHAPFEERHLDGATYLRFDSFMDPAMIDRALEALERGGERGIVLDLRFNHGGLRDEMLRLMSRLLPDGSLVATEVTRGSETPLRTRGTRAYAGPLIVLIGPSTASAAEITAAALQDQKRARVLGRPSAGSTLTSLNFPLPDGGQAQVATADLKRPSGQRIEGVGVVPDVGIMPTIDDVRAGRDPALERAVLELGGAQTTASTDSRSPAG